MSVLQINLTFSLAIVEKLLVAIICYLNFYKRHSSSQTKFEIVQYAIYLGLYYFYI